MATYSDPYMAVAAGHRPDESDSCRLDRPTVTRRAEEAARAQVQVVVPPDAALNAYAVVIIDAIRRSLALAEQSMPASAAERANNAGLAIEAGVRNGVTAIGAELAAEVERLRGMMIAAADVLDPAGAPECFDLDPGIARQLGRTLRAAGRVQ